MKESDVHKVWCPKYQVSEEHRTLKDNRGEFRSVVCLGSLCGAWVWDDEENGHCGFINHKPPDEIKVTIENIPEEIRISNMEQFKVIVENAFAEPDIEEKPQL